MILNYSNISSENLCQDIHEELYIIDAIISSIHDICLNLELNSKYYNNENVSKKLSEERNRYITLLNIALEKIKNIEEINNEIETNLS